MTASADQGSTCSLDSSLAFGSAHGRGERGDLTGTRFCADPPPTPGGTVDPNARFIGNQMGGGGGGDAL